MSIGLKATTKNTIYFISGYLQFLIIFFRKFAICKWPFWDTSGLLFDNCIFHKTEVPMVILRFVKCLNLIWIKRYNIKHKLFCFFSVQNCSNLTKFGKKIYQKRIYEWRNFKKNFSRPLFNIIFWPKTLIVGTKSNLST